MITSQAQLAMEKALEEDPTVYEYDSIYDDMQKVKQGPDGKSKKKEAEKKVLYSILYPVVLMLVRVNCLAQSIFCDVTLVVNCTQETT